MNPDENAPRLNLVSALGVTPKRPWPLIGATALGLVALAATLAFHRAPPPEASPSTTMKVNKESVSLTPQAPQWKVLKLAQAKVPELHWTDAYPARFVVDEARAAKVGTPLAGRVTTVHVVLGQTVKAGQPLFAVASPDIAGLRAEREKAAVGLDVSRAAYERVKAMVDARALPAKDAIESDQQLREAALSLKLAEQKLRSLKVSSSGDNEFTVVSPREGVVIEKNVLPSQQVDAGAPLLSVADLSSVRVQAELFEADAGGLVKGAKARVTSPSLPGFSADVEVELISQVADPERHTVGVWARLDNHDGQIRPNSYAEMRLAREAPAGAVAVPTSALVTDGAHQYIYVEAEAGHFVRRPVVAGSSRDDELLVYRGLKPGEPVVEQGAVLLDNQISLIN